MKLKLTTENKPIHMLVISVLVLCISSDRSKHSRWLSRMETHGVQKNS